LFYQALVNSNSNSSSTK